MQAVPCSGPIPGHEINPPIMAAQEGVPIVVSTGPEWLAKPHPPPQRRSRAIILEQLNSVASNRIKPIAIHEQSLRTARTELLGNHLERRKDPVPGRVNQAANGLPITNEQPALAIERCRIASPGKFRPRGPT